MAGTADGPDRRRSGPPGRCSEADWSRRRHHGDPQRPGSPTKEKIRWGPSPWAGRHGSSPGRRGPRGRIWKFAPTNLPSAVRTDPANDLGRAGEIQRPGGGKRDRLLCRESGSIGVRRGGCLHDVFAGPQRHRVRAAPFVITERASVQGLFTLRTYTRARARARPGSRAPYRSAWRRGQVDHDAGQVRNGRVRREWIQSRCGDAGVGVGLRPDLDCYCGAGEAAGRGCTRRRPRRRGRRDRNALRVHGGDARTCQTTAVGPEERAVESLERARPGRTKSRTGPSCRRAPSEAAEEGRRLHQHLPRTLRNPRATIPAIESVTRHLLHPSGITGA